MLGLCGSTCQFEQCDDLGVLDEENTSCISGYFKSLVIRIAVFIVTYVLLSAVIMFCTLFIII